ncbi:hypothetical protein [Streptomyces fagopyri]|uniref:hypothetical protein n=1 Tax=Streptomyces fagopyri TaxID=2662397 RepID=UPI003723DBD7
MTEDFEAVLHRGSEELAARTSALPAATLRARGDDLRRRRRLAVTALTITLVASVAGGTFALTTPSGEASRPGAVVNPTTPLPLPTPTPSPSASGPRCRSLVVPPEVKEAVTQAYRRAQPGLTHFVPVKGTFYYGECDGVFYAGTSFTPTADATEGELVQLQDAGGAEKYFTKSEDGAWTFTGTDGFPRDPRGCAAIPEIPARLAELWDNCLARP